MKWLPILFLVTQGTVAVPNDIAFESFEACQIVLPGIVFDYMRRGAPVINAACPPEAVVHLNWPRDATEDEEAHVRPSLRPRPMHLMQPTPSPGA